MKSDPAVKPIVLFPTKLLRSILVAAATWFSAMHPSSAATNIVLWDAGKSFADSENLGERTAWVAVPSELFIFEADPPKAASDPGYYGREYSFKGDAVVENRSLTAVFQSATGRVLVYSKASAPVLNGGGRFGHKVVEISPHHTKAGSGKISTCEVVRNAGDELVLKVTFSAAGSPDASAVFSFGPDEIMAIKPDLKMKRITLQSPIEYGVVPGFVGDDLIFGPSEFTDADTLTLPVENVFVGLLKGQSDQLVMTWPKGKQQLQLQLASDSKGKRVIESVDFETDGQSFYLAAASAPGIWHREELKPTFLEKDVAVAWKRPFPAKWKTQLTEANVQTTFNFRDAKGTIWRGVPGSYNYPVWFAGDSAYYHLSKKVPPKGESIIYFLEGENTPPDVTTPVDVVRSTLGRQISESLLDPEGRKLRTHHRRGGDGVHRACTCGCTEAIQAVFEAGHEVAKKNDVQEALGDMNFFVECHLERIDEYTKFAADMIQFLQQKAKDAPALKPFCESLEQIVQQIPQEYEVQKENMKSLKHAEDLTRQTLALTATKSTNNVAAYMELLKAWRAMGGAQDYVVAQCHMIARKLFQEAGYSAARDGRTVAVAQEVRSRCRQVLRNPDGYEIWADY